MKKQDVVIIGGGISGTAAAYELARTGASVTLVEKGGLASMASGWTLAGVRQSGRHPAELPLAQAAVRRWATLSEELGADVEYRQDGNLRLARSPEEVEIIRKIVEEQQALGLDLTFLPDHAAVYEVAPNLSSRVVAASFCPTDGHANPTATVDAFAEAAKRQGATILTETAATQIEVTGGRVTGVQTSAGAIAADAVVVAANLYADRLSTALDLPLPLYPRHVAAVQTTPMPPLIKQVIGVANADFAGRQEVSGRMRMTNGGMAWQWPKQPIEEADILPPAWAVVSALQSAIGLFDAMKEAKIARVWGGLIAMTPDGLPVIEQTPEIAGLVIAAGFSGHGFCLGPITGQIIRELVTTGDASLPLHPFRRDRFAQSGQAAAELYG